MEKLKSIFGDGALTWEELSGALAQSGIELADISDGGYVEKARHDAELDALKMGGAVDMALLRAGARNPAIARAALDMSALALTEGGVTGLPEQIARLKRTDAYLFDGPGPRVGTGQEHGGTPPDYAGMTDEEYYAGVMGR